MHQILTIATLDYPSGPSLTINQIKGIFLLAIVTRHVNDITGIIFAGLFKAGEVILLFRDDSHLLSVDSQSSLFQLV